MTGSEGARDTRSPITGADLAENNRIQPQDLTLIKHQKPAIRAWILDWPPEVEQQSDYFCHRCVTNG